MDHVLEPRSFANLTSVAGLSRTTLDEHYQLYCGYVKKANSLSERLTAIQMTPELASAVDIVNIKGDLCFALAAVRNHEMYFDILGSRKISIPAMLQEQISANFGSMDNYLEDLRRTAMGTRGWTWTVMDQHTGRLWNFSGHHNGQFPFWDARPILTLDLCDHAYFYDFGHHRADYVNCLIDHLNWEKPAEFLTLGSQSHRPPILAGT
jgi:Fe-Mn family superoxide dismutase